MAITTNIPQRLTLVLCSHVLFSSCSAPRPHRCMNSFQSYSTFSSENLSVSDGEEGNTSDHSHSGPLEQLSASQEEHLDELLSHTPEIPIDISTQSDGLSDKECAVRRVKTQMSLGKLCADEHSYEVNSRSYFIQTHLSNASFKSGTAGASWGYEKLILWNRCIIKNYQNNW